MVILFWMLFFATLLGGLAVAMQSTIPASVLPFLLAFSGGYLLAVTLLHLLPELFISEIAPLHIGSYMLMGFFLQRIIELFSGGVEHGHAMASDSKHEPINQHKVLPFLICITLHALLDGAILVHGHLHHCVTRQMSLAAGILLHKALEAFAFVGVLRSFSLTRSYYLFYLVLFSLASPLGLWISNYIKHYLSEYISIMLLAIVTGNFLYIAATILFEANPGHRFNQVAFWVSLLGASLAAYIEFLG
ncbi:MAG: ZIP family metal transporter [Candidatus Cardinium sp.]|nr:ZIP family metal transporter [Candidatus Cardinium sp.]